MKKMIAALAALACVVGCMTFVPDTMTKTQDNFSIVACAATKEEVKPGVNADKYTYKYADSSVYPHTVAAAKMEVSSKDEDLKALAIEVAGSDGKGIFNEKGYKLGIYTVTVQDGKEKKVEYHVGLTAIKESILDLKVSDIEVPAQFEAYVEKAFSSATLVDPSHVTLIADGAFKGTTKNPCYLKTVDLTGVQIIGKDAFNGASYITEVTIPKTVKYVGTGIFSGSGLKTLDVQNEMPVIPSNFCSGTKLTAIKFAHPELIRTIGSSAFANSPIGEPIFNSWGAASGYEPLTVEDSAYENCGSITSVNMSDNVIQLQKSTFKGCTKLSSVTFGKNTSSADAESFAGCIALDTITFSPNLLSLGGGVFSKCTGLKRVEGFPDTIEDWQVDEKDKNKGWGFGNNMFAGDTSLVSVELPKSITMIPEGCFAGCTALTTVYNNDNIVAVGKESFKGCTSLVEAVYPKLTTVNASAFEGCKSLLAANYPNVTMIAAGGFKGCTAMTSFEVGKCTTVGNNALEGCTALKSITLMANEYGEYVFKGCSVAETIKVNGAALDMIPTGLFAECAALKKVDADLSNTSIIGKSAFSKCTALEQTQFSNVRIIETSAFADCTSLVSITSGGKPIEAEDYGAKCFQNCTSLAIDVDGSISTIGESAFENSGIKKVNLDGMTGGTVVVGASAFAKCPNLTEAKISASKVAEFSIGSSVFSASPVLKKAVFDGPIITMNMFKDCTELAYVDTNATSIKTGAFSGCTMLEGLYTVDHSTPLIAKDIAGTAFQNCKNLKSAPSDITTVFSGDQQYAGCESITTITTNALTAGMFNGCTSLKEANVPNDIKSIPASCFAKCTSLANYDLSGILEVGKSAFSGSGITAVKMDSAQTINNGAFQNCAELKEIDINVTKIDANAFNNCAFMDKAVICTESIGSSAFKGCASLKEVTLQSSEAHTLEKIEGSAFDSCNILYELVVPGSPSIGKSAFGMNGKNVNQDFVLVGTPGSSVEKYAADNKVAFEDVANFDLSARQGKRHTKGDVDGNSIISVVDAVKMQKWVLNKSCPGIYAENMDINEDGVVDVFDLGLLKRTLRR